MTKDRLQRLFDRAAIALSSLCLLHCLLLPLAVIGVPVLGYELIGHPVWHALFLGAAVPLSAVALWLGYRRHRRPHYMLVATTGLALMALAFLLDGATRETAVTMLGVALVAGAHWVNQRASKAAISG